MGVITLASVVVPVVVPVVVIVAVIVAVIVVIIISIIVSIIVPVIIIIPIVIPIIIMIMVMTSPIPIMHNTSLTQRNQGRRLLPLTDALPLRAIIVVHRVAFMRDAHHRAADVPALVRHVVLVEGVG